MTLVTAETRNERLLWSYEKLPKMRRDLIVCLFYLWHKSFALDTLIREGQGKDKGCVEKSVEII